MTSNLHALLYKTHNKVLLTLQYQGSKVYVPNLYAQIKYESTPVYIENKKGGGAYISIKKELLTLNMFPKNKQKLGQTKKDEIK